MRSALAYVVAGSALAMISARADEQLPTINGTAYCTTTAELVDDEAFKQQCLDSEAKAEGHFRALWAETPDSVRAACVKDLMLVTPSYQVLSTCMSTMVGEMWMAGELKVVPR
ncbi:hypothetical protein ASG32_30930 [Methylobacterium sp. Leaf361]|uniref:hypothetical protein n=1 Tax=Methylobacterium sp. Leaf361 TaxID=1736352 RepID=UPI0006FA1C1F|nr:hypothetical protein [Methylobacterium sp. Leaf361]KQS65950.1 hypothetical protein ASG32_30930 [Methylobacterium sp. Leaf361]